MSNETIETRRERHRAEFAEAFPGAVVSLGEFQSDDCDRFVGTMGDAEVGLMWFTSDFGEHYTFDPDSRIGNTPSEAADKALIAAGALADALFVGVAPCS